MIYESTLITDIIEPKTIQRVPKPKNPIELLFGKDDNRSLKVPGPGQYNIPSGFQSNIRQRIKNASVDLSK